MTRLRSNGLYATYNGTEYRATSNANGLIHLLWDGDSAPEGFAASPVPRRWRLVVTPYDLTRLTMVRTRCLWRGHHFEVTKVDGNDAVVDYLDDDHSWAGANVLEAVDRDRWIATLPVSELADITEDHIDVLPLNRSKFVDAGSPAVAT